MTGTDIPEQTFTQGLLVKQRAGRWVLVTIDEFLKYLTGGPKGLKGSGQRDLKEEKQIMAWLMSPLLYVAYLKM